MSEVLTAPAEVVGNAAAIAAPQEAERMLAVARSYAIDDDDMFEAAGEELRTVVTRARQLDELRKSITAPMDEAKRRVMDFFRVPLERLQEAESVIKASMSTYQRRQLELREAARREAEAAQARARAEAERVAVQARAAEAAAQAERDRLQAEAEAQMRQAMDKGDAEAMARAEEVAAQAASVVVQAAPTAEEVAAQVVAATPVVPMAPRAAGVSFKTVWKARVVDMAALIRGAAGRPEIEALLKVDETALGQFARATGGKARLAGVEFYEDTVTSARRRA